MKWLNDLFDGFFERHSERVRVQHEHELELLRLEQEHELELRVCHSCEALKTQIEAQNLLIRELTKKEPVVEIERHAPQPIYSRHKPWRVRRQELEKADKELAEKLKKEKLAAAEITVDNLEKELADAN